MAMVAGALVGFAFPKREAQIAASDPESRSVERERPRETPPPASRARAPAARELPRWSAAATANASAFDRWRAAEASPQDLYNGELRDLRWAPAMEDAIRARFDPEKLRAAGVAGLELAELQCRQTMCLVAFEFPSALRAELHAGGLDRNLTPVDQYLNQTGRLSAIATVIDSKPAPRADGSAGERVTGLIAFSGEEIDPARYPRWVEQQVQQRGAK